MAGEKALSHARPSVEVISQTVAGHVLVSPVRLRGTGVFTGQPCRLLLESGEPGGGVVLVLGGDAVAAVAENARDYPNCSGLAGKNTSVLLVEHLLSALFGLGVFDARVTVEGPEIPLWDGSALPFVKKLQPRLKAVRTKRKVVRLLSPFEVSLDNKAGALAFSPGRGFAASYQLDYDEPPFHQRAKFAGAPQKYAASVAPARTFIGEDQALRLRAAGILKGGSRRNAVVLTEKNLPAMAWRVPQEAAQHKILDLMGDLALVGAPLWMTLAARHTGHAENRLAASLIRQSARKKGL